MMHSIVAWSLRNRRMVIAMTLAMMVVGVWRLNDAKVDELPEFSPPTVEVQTEALGLSAEEVEQLITVPIEQDLLSGIAWLDVIRSRSVPGLSSIEMIFEPGTDLIKARQVVQERMTQAHALPQVSKPPQMLQPLSSTSRVMMVKVSSETLSPIELSVLARWTIRPRLMGARGVANVAIWGQRERQLQVQIDPARLNKNKVTVEQVIATAGNALWVSPLTFLEASTPGTGGFIDTPNQRLGVQHLSPIKAAKDLAQVAIEEREGAPIRLGDVADVVEDHQPLIGDAVFTDGTGLMLVIEKFPNADTLEVTRAIDSAFEALRPGLKGVSIDTSVYRPARLVDTASDRLRLAILFGAVALALSLALLFLDWRTAIVSILSVGAALIASALVLYMRGTTFHAMVVAGLVLSVIIVVDDAVVDADLLSRRITDARTAGSTEPVDNIVLRGSLETRSLAAYGAAIILMSLVPIFVMDGLSTDSFFPPVASSYALAVLASFVVALTFTPALTAELFSRSSARRRTSPLLRPAARLYERATAFSARRPWPIIAAGALVAIVCLGTFPMLDKAVRPTFNDTDLIVAWDGPPGTSLAEMSRVTQRAERELKGVAGIENVGAHVGRAITSDQVVGINSGEIWLRVKSGANYPSTVRRVQAVIDGYPGLRTDVLSYPEQRVRKVLTGTSDPLVVRIFGQDLEVLRTKAGEVRAMVAGLDGVSSARADLQIDEPTMKIEVDLESAQKYSLKPGDVRRAAATLISGIEVGSLFEDQKVFEVVVRGTPAMRESLTSVQMLLVDTPDGSQVHLGDVANVSIGPTPNVIEHEAVRRSIDVTATASGRSVASIRNEIRSELAKMSFPLEHHAEVLGDYQDLQNARRRFVTVCAAALVAVLLLLQVAFTSWRRAFAVTVTSFVGIGGGLVAALLANGQTISFGASIAFLALFGLTVRNGLLLVGRWHQLESESPDQDTSELVSRSAKDRLPSVLTTAAASGIAFLVLALFGNRLGYEIVHPLSIVLLGGLVTSTFVSLFVLPAVVSRFPTSPLHNTV